MLLAAMGLAAGTGHAAEPGRADVLREKRATPSDLAAVYPRAALAQKITGDVMLDCAADAKGNVVDCKVAKEKPLGQSFGEAALSLAPRERIKTSDWYGAPVGARRFDLEYSFLAPGDSNPDWLRRPTGEDLATAYPVAGAKKRVNGRAVIHCKVTTEGFLQACEVKDETPPDLGFGKAAILLSAQFRMTPKIRGGKPVEGEITIPIVWTGMDQYAPSPQETVSVVTDPPWIKSPSPTQVAAAWPSNAGDVTSGQVMFRCDLGADGRLRSCETVAEEPRSKGFSKAARGLLPLFQVNVSPKADTNKFQVDVPFRFRAPGQADGRKITNPTWVRTLTEDSMASLYPKAALAAGALKGLGVAACVVNAAGDLTDCRIQRESPAGLGFGEAAVAAAQLMGMNPWSREGDPMEGLPLVLPIRFEWSDPLPAQAAPPAPAKP